MVGLNGAPRPYLFTEEIRLTKAIEEARRLHPHAPDRFRGYVRREGCVSEDTAHTHWLLWRHEYLARPLGERLAEMEAQS